MDILYSGFYKINNLIFFGKAVYFVFRKNQFFIHSDVIDPAGPWNQGWAA